MVNPAFLKIGLGGAVVTSAGTTGIVYKNQIKDFFVKHFSSTTSTYLIVKTSATPDSDFSNGLYSTDKKTKNFDCIVTSNKNAKDENCELFEINAPKTNKLNNLEEIKNSTTKTTKEKITTDTFFKLTISDSALGTTWDGTQTVDIVSKTENKDSGSEKKKYGTFTLQYKVVNTTDNVSIEGKTNWIIGKVTANTSISTISSTSNLTCSISGETPSVSSACLIFKIDTTETDIKNIETSNIKDPTTTTTDYVKDKFFIIDLKKADKKNISDFTGKTITVNVTSGNEKIADFSFVTALVDKDVFATTSKTIILS